MRDHSSKNRNSDMNKATEAALTLALTCSSTLAAATGSLSPAGWPTGEYRRYLEAQGSNHLEAGHASGRNGAVTVAYNALAARAGLEALQQGGNAIDAALTAALTQVSLTAGAPVSYFGILSLVYYDAKTGKVYTMNAEWNTVRGETDPSTIPGKIDLSSEDAALGTEPSGRTALVGGFMKGVEAAHQRFGRLPFRSLFEPAIYVADYGMPVTRDLAGFLSLRYPDLKRLPATRTIFTKPDGSDYRAGDTFYQHQLAETLRAVASHGADYMYKGPWAKKLVQAVRADGGRMTLEDLAQYEVIWDEPLVGSFGAYQIYTNPPPNLGGVALIEAQNLARAAGLARDGHWSKSGPALRKALDVSQAAFLDYLPDEVKRQLYPGLDFSSAARVTPAHAEALWKRMQAGATPFRWVPADIHHSDDVVAIDHEGNIAALTHSINSVFWGKTAINIDGVSIGDPASFQQMPMAKVTPGGRLPAPTEQGILFKGGKPTLGFASMGSGLHQRTFQALFNITEFGMSVRAATDAPDFFLPQTDLKTAAMTVMVPKGRFETRVLESTGYAYEEVASERERLKGEGVWIGISRDPATGVLEAASHNRSNSAAVAY
jgi:gamma-glutamyltranspeptidase/glutathione hydrolase